ARGLISAFAETDPNPPNDRIAGLFVWDAASTVPAAGTRTVGLARLISVNDLVDPTKGGDAQMLRDGSNFGVDPSADGSFNDLLMSFDEKLDTQETFNTAAGSTVALSLKNYSASTVGWLEDARKTAAGAAETRSALILRTTEALSNLTSVNIDEEMALMLELEHSYSASAKMLQVIDEMLQTLLAAVR